MIQAWGESELVYCIQPASKSSLPFEDSLSTGLLSVGFAGTGTKAEAFCSLTPFISEYRSILKTRTKKNWSMNVQAGSPNGSLERSGYSQRQLPEQSFMTEGLANIWNIALCNIIARNARSRAVRPKPSGLKRVFESTLIDGMLRQFTHVDGTELVDLRCDGVLFDQRLFCESELQRIIGGQRDIEPSLEEASTWVLVICQEQCIVTEG